MPVITKTNPIVTSDEKPFPKLMISEATKVIVLFTENNVGTILVRGKNSNIVGHYSEDWSMEFFKDYDGEIQISNE